jgi:hypothetical protein
VLKVAHEKNLLRGKTVAVDATTLEANAICWDEKSQDVLSLEAVPRDNYTGHQTPSGSSARSQHRPA